eukprot:1320281-Amorphochlora_amoeboformis.AAC.1
MSSERCYLDNVARLALCAARRPKHRLRERDQQVKQSLETSRLRDVETSTPQDLGLDHVHQPLNLALST